MAASLGAALLAARGRRIAVAGKADIRIEWFLKETVGKVNLTMRQRVRLATKLVKVKVVKNISRPVTITSGPRGGRVVTNRSKKGEFPKVETSQLMKTIFDQTAFVRNGWEGYIGTPLDYGAILEISDRLDRSFLVRTLNEQGPIILRILTQSIK